MPTCCDGVSFGVEGCGPVHDSAAIWIFIIRKARAHLELVARQEPVGDSVQLVCRLASLVKPTRIRSDYSDQPLLP